MCLQIKQWIRFEPLYSILNYSSFHADIDEDYVIMPSNLTFTVENEASIYKTYCVSLYIIEDLLAEAEEQFELYFEVDSDYIGIGDNATVCINIEDTDGIL